MAMRSCARWLNPGRGIRTSCWPVGSTSMGGAVLYGSSSMKILCFCQTSWDTSVGYHGGSFAGPFRIQVFQQNLVYIQIYPDIRWNLVAIKCESKTEDTAGKLTSCSGSS